jgi:hypothetical protein
MSVGKDAPYVWASVSIKMKCYDIAYHFSVLEGQCALIPSTVFPNLARGHFK